MKKLILILIVMMCDTQMSQGQKILYWTEDSLLLFDVPSKSLYNLLPLDKSSKSWLWNNSKFEFKNNVGIFYRYMYDYTKRNTYVREYVFDTLQYNLLASKEYTLSGNKEDEYRYNYHYRKSLYGCGGGNIYKRTDSGYVVFMSKENLGKTQYRYNTCVEIPNNKLICERWHVKYDSDKHRVEPVKVFEIDIETKEMTFLFLTGGWNLFTSNDDRFLLYSIIDSQTENYGVYDIQKKETICKFHGYSARWIQ